MQQFKITQLEKGLFILSSNSSLDLKEISIYDLIGNNIGNKLLKIDAEKSEVFIDLRNHASGIYMIQVNSFDQYFQTKVYN